MIGFIFALTLQQLTARKSMLLPVGLAFIPLVVAIVFRLSEPDVDPNRWAARTLIVGLIITAVLPLTALLFGASVLGDELEDGTAVYLLTKPLPRWQILLPKIAASALITIVLVGASVEVSGSVALEGQGDMRMLSGFFAAIAIGAVAYTTVFVLISLITSRALIAGLVYVFLWEATVTSIFTGTRYFSVRHYILGLARWLGDLRPDILDAQMSGPLALLLVCITICGAAFIANRRLREVEVREQT